MDSARIRRGSAVGLAATALIAAVALADPGDRDPSFGTTGSVLYGQVNSTRFHDVAVHPLGGFVAAGRATYTTAGGGLSPLLVTRHLEDGAIDTTWGNQPVTLQDGADRRGSFRMVGDSSTEAHGVALDAQNRILVTAETPNGPETGGGLMLLRLTPTGQLDTSYSGDGKSAVVPVDTDIDIVATAIGPDGSVSVGVNHDVAGQATLKLYRFTSAGILDTSFSGDGIFSSADAEVTDLIVDTAGRITYARASLGGDPQEPTRIHQVRRLTTAGVADTSFNNTGAVSLPAAINAHAIKLAYVPGLTLTFAGSASPAPGGVNFRAVQILTDGTLAPEYGGTGNGGVGTGFLPGYSAPVPRGIAVLSDRKVVIAARVSAPDGAPRIGLVRLRDGGTTDSSFRPSAPDIRFAKVDQLGLPATTTVDPVGGIVAVAEDKVVLAGMTDGNASDLAFLARFGAAGDPPNASVTRSYRPIGDPPTVRDFSRPGNPVDFTANATDAEGPIAAYEWSVDGGAFQPGEATFSPGLGAGEHTVTVRVTDTDGQNATASATSRALENEAPTAGIGAAHDTYNPTSIPATLEEDRYIILKALASDTDGEIKRIEWDLDGVSGFEKTGIYQAIKFPTPGKRTIGMRAIDNEGKTTFKQVELDIINAPCQASRSVTIGRLRAFAPCWNKKVEGSTTIWQATKPPPPPPPPPPGVFQANDPFVATSTTYVADVIAAPTSINGIFFANYDVLQIVEKPGKDPKISYSGARIVTPSIYGTPLTLSDGGGDTWTFDKSAHRIEGVALNRGRWGSLDVGELAEPIALTALGKARLRFYPLLPAALGSASSDQVQTITTGGAAASASAVARAAQSGGLDCFEASGAKIQGLEFVPGDVRICRDATDPDLWKLRIGVDLASFGGGLFELPKITVNVQIRRDFVSIFGDADFGAGIPLIGPVLLTGIDFQLVLNPKEGDIAVGKDGGLPKCVPGWDKRVFSLQPLRDVLIDKGVSRARANQAIPDILIDYGIPKTTACGGLSFAVNIGETGLADGNISIGYADYTDRVDAFRAIGNARLLGNDDYRARIALSVYSNGYAEMQAEIDLVFFDLISVDGGVRVQVLPKEGWYNAEAWVKGCVIPLDFCSSIKALISNRGVGGCLGLYFLGGEWEPGATYHYSDGLSLYLSGCDLDDVRQEFDGQGSTIVSYIPPPSARQSTVFERGPLPRARITQTAKPEQKLEVKPGLPGVYFAARGQDNQLPRFTLTGPKGERISVDGRADGKAMEGRDLIVGHDATTGVSHVLIGSPSPGTWTLTPDAGSPPIIGIVSSEGLDKPKIDGKVTGRGRQRALAYSLTPRSGQTVRFEERGATGKQLLGSAGRGRKGTIRFKTAAGKAEKREIVAVIEQDGMLREEQVVATYRAPATGRPTRVGRALARRSGTKVVLRWLPATDAERYLVTGTLSNGRKLRVEVAKRTTTIRRVPRNATGRLKVVGINELGRAGRATTVRLKKPKRRR